MPRLPCHRRTFEIRAQNRSHRSRGFGLIFRMSGIRFATLALDLESKLPNLIGEFAGKITSPVVCAQVGVCKQSID